MLDALTVDYNTVGSVKKPISYSVVVGYTAHCTKCYLASYTATLLHHQANVSAQPI